MLLEGVFAAIPTPFQPDGRPHWHNLERNVERYCRSPLAGLVVLGSTGEAVMLNDEETREALRVARNAAADDRILIAGVGHESLIETLKRIEHAASLDYDLALVRTPHFYRPQLLRSQMRPAELLNYYRMVADASASRTRAGSRSVSATSLQRPPPRLAAMSPSPPLLRPSPAAC
jgi:4-hydroxy-2-oxoglutarate aldolase